MSKQIQDAYIVAATRTPVGKAPKGVFRNTRPDDMLAHVLKSADFLLASAHSRDSDLNAYLREREEPFSFGADGAALFQMLDDFERRLPARLADIDEHDLADVVTWQGGPWQPASVAWCLLGVVEHLRKHVAASALTRHTAPACQDHAGHHCTSCPREASSPATSASMRASRFSRPGHDACGSKESGKL